MAESRARVTGLRRVAAETLELTLAPVSPARFAFRPGQFVSLACGPDAAGKLQRRSSSLASPASATDRATLLVKLVPGGHGSAYVAGLRPGDEVGFTGPKVHGRRTEDVADGRERAPSPSVGSNRWPNGTARKRGRHRSASRVV